MPTESLAAHSGTRSLTKYDAFISYGGLADKETATRLRAELHRLTRPWYRVRAMRVFCAPAELSTNSGLWPTLAKSLADSRFLILLGSPAAAVSPWVERELSWWKENRTPDTMLIAVTDGTVRWATDHADFDWSATTAVPAMLTGYFSDEPFYTSITESGQLPDGAAELAGAIRGCSKGDTLGEDIRQHRRSLRLALSAVAVFVVLALVATLLGVLARQQQNRAENESAIAVSRYLAGQSEAQARGNPQASMLLAAAAWQAAPTEEARAAVLSDTGRWDTIVQYLSDPGLVPITSAASDPAAGLLVTAMEDGRLTFWDVATGTVRRTVMSGIAAPTALTFLNDRGRIAVGGADGALAIWDVTTGERVAQLTVDGYRPLITTLAVTPEDPFILAAGDSFGQVVLWDLEDNQPYQYFDTSGRSVTGIAFQPEGELLASVTTDGAVELWARKHSARLVTCG